MRRNVDFTSCKDSAESFSLKRGLWYTAVWRIDHGDWPSVSTLPLSSTRLSIYADSAD